MLNNLKSANDPISEAELFDKLKSNELNSKSLILLSKLVREIRKTNGNVTKLHDNSSIATQVAETNSPELNKLFCSFLEEAS